MGFEVVVNRNLLNQILVEEGMDPERVQRIRIRFIHSQERTRKQKLSDFMLLGGSAGGYWIEDQETAVVITNQLRSAERVLEVLAHELGHGIDKARASYFLPVKVAWGFYLAALAGSAVWLGWWLANTIESLDPYNGAFVVLGMAILWLYTASLSTVIFWPMLLQVLFYWNSTVEKSARDWEKRLTARPDWEQALTVREVV